MKTIIVGLIFFLIILGIADYYIPDSNFIQDYIRGSFTETIGIIITVIFIQYFLDKKSAINIKSKELNKIIRRDILIRHYIDNFTGYAKTMTFPKRPKKQGSLSLEEINLEENFDFKLLESVYMPSLSLFDGIEPAFRLFFENQEKLIQLIKNILLNDDIKYFPEYEELLLNFIKQTEPYNPYKSIDLAYKNSRGQKQNDILEIKIIKEHTGPVKYLQGNTKNSYIRLYELININIKFNKEYEELILKYKNLNS